MPLTVNIDKPEAKSQSKAQSPKKGQRNLASGLVTKILWATTHHSPITFRGPECAYMVQIVVQSSPEYPRVAQSRSEWPKVAQFGVVSFPIALKPYLGLVFIDPESSLSLLSNDVQILAV